MRLASLTEELAERRSPARATKRRCTVAVRRRHSRRPCGVAANGMKKAAFRYEARAQSYYILAPCAPTGTRKQRAAKANWTKDTLALPRQWQLSEVSTWYDELQLAESLPNSAADHGRSFIHDGALRRWTTTPRFRFHPRACPQMRRPAHQTNQSPRLRHHSRLRFTGVPLPPAYSLPRCESRICR